MSIKYKAEGWDVIEIHAEGQFPALSKKILQGFTYDIISRSLE